MPSPSSPVPRHAQPLEVDAHGHVSTRLAHHSESTTAHQAADHAHEAPSLVMGLLASFEALLRSDTAVDTAAAAAASCSCACVSS